MEHFLPLSYGAFETTLGNLNGYFLCPIEDLFES